MVKVYKTAIPELLAPAGQMFGYDVGMYIYLQTEPKILYATKVELIFSRLMMAMVAVLVNVAVLQFNGVCFAHFNNLTAKVQGFARKWVV